MTTLLVADLNDPSEQTLEDIKESLARRDGIDLTLPSGDQDGQNDPDPFNSA